MSTVTRLDLDRYVTVTEYAALHGVTHQRVSQWIKSRRLPHRTDRHGRRWILRDEPRPERLKPGPAPKSA